MMDRRNIYRLPYTDEGGPDSGIVQVIGVALPVACVSLLVNIDIFPNELTKTQFTFSIPSHTLVSQDPFPLICNTLIVPDHMGGMSSDFVVFP